MLAELFSRTSFPSLCICSYSRPGRGVGATARVGHSHCESEGDVCSRVLYWFTPTSLEFFDLMIRNKNAIQLRVPHLLSLIILFSINLVLNLHIMYSAHLSKCWDQVDCQGSLCSLITNDYEEGYDIIFHQIFRDLKTLVNS